jgi:F-type H+-transporting ATPase subunit b
MVTNLIQNLGDSSSGLGALGFSGSSFLIQLITFILAYLVLRRFAFGPITKVLSERRELIDKGVSLGEQMKKEKVRLEDDIRKQLSEAREKADAIIASAEQSSKDSIHAAEAKAQEKADIILSEAKLKTTQEMANAKRKLEHEIADLVAVATEVLTGEKVDAKKDSKLITKAIYGQAKA